MYIVVSVGSYRAMGYRDFLFALKLAAGIRERIRDTAKQTDTPECLIVTGEEGKAKITDLKGDEEFALSVLTFAECHEHLKQKPAPVQLLIEGPAFNPDWPKSMRLLVTPGDVDVSHCFRSTRFLRINEYGAADATGQPRTVTGLGLWLNDREAMANAASKNWDFVKAINPGLLQVSCSAPFDRLPEAGLLMTDAPEASSATTGQNEIFSQLDPHVLTAIRLYGRQVHVDTSSAAGFKQHVGVSFSYHSMHFTSVYHPIKETMAKFFYSHLASVQHDPRSQCIFVIGEIDWLLIFLKHACERFIFKQKFGNFCIIDANPETVGVIYNKTSHESHLSDSTNRSYIVSGAKLLSN